MKPYNVLEILFNLTEVVKNPVYSCKFVKNTKIEKNRVFFSCFTLFTDSLNSEPNVKVHGLKPLY